MRSVGLLLGALLVPLTSCATAKHGMSARDWKRSCVPRQRPATVAIDAPDVLLGRWRNAIPYIELHDDGTATLNSVGVHDRRGNLTTLTGQQTTWTAEDGILRFDFSEADYRRMERAGISDYTGYEFVFRYQLVDESDARVLLLTPVKETLSARAQQGSRTYAFCYQGTYQR